jgi:hypothetical protein
MHQTRLRSRSEQLQRLRASLLCSERGLPAPSELVSLAGNTQRRRNSWSSGKNKLSVAILTPLVEIALSRAIHKLCFLRGVWFYCLITTFQHGKHFKAPEFPLHPR